MLLLFVCAALFASTTTAYSIPDPQFEVLKPSGLKVSIPGEHGTQVFSFHGNVNKEMQGLEAGQIFKDVSVNENGKFTVYDENVKLKNGDVIYYWVYVYHNGLGYHLDNGKFIYREGSNLKERECPPGYKKKASKNDGEMTDLSSGGGHDHWAGSHGLSNYHGNYQHGFRPNIYYGRPWYSFHHHRGHWHQFRRPRFDYTQGRGQNHNFRFHVDQNVATIWHNGVPDHIFPIVKRQTSSEEDESSPEDTSETDGVNLESRFGQFGFPPNFIRRPPHRPAYKHYRPHNGHEYRGHGYGYGNSYERGGYGYHHGQHRPYIPTHHPYPFPNQPGFGKGDHNKFNDYYDCEEDDSNEGGFSPEPAKTTPKIKPVSEETEVSSPKENPTTTTTSTTTTSTTTQRTSTFPQIDIRFGGS